jgi:hypothetical protein
MERDSPSPVTSHPYDTSTEQQDPPLPLLRHGESYLSKPDNQPAVLLNASLPKISPKKLTRRLF